MYQFYFVLQQILLIVLVRESIKIKESPPGIFDYLLKVENRKDFIPALEEVIIIDPLPIKKGTRYIEVAQIAGRRLKTIYQITDLQVNKRITAQTIQSIFPITADLILKEEEDATQLTILLDFKLSGIFKIASGLINTIVANQTKSILRKVKSHFESE